MSVLIELGGASVAPPRPPARYAGVNPAPLAAVACDRAPEPPSPLRRSLPPHGGEPGSAARSVALAERFPRAPAPQPLRRSLPPHGGASGSATAAISDREFALFQGLIHRQAGIHLAPVKKALLVGRLMRRLRDLGLSSFGAYYRVVTEPGGEAEQVRMLDSICTNETHFFREPRQFEFLERQVFPEWAEQAASGQRLRKIRAWSAACSTGEEPYTLAMVLLLRFPDWQIEILGSDLSTRVLESARAGLYRIEKAAEIPDTYRKAFMLCGTGSQQGRMKAGPEIRSLVRFERLNLSHQRWALSGAFDLLFCRNVLIYFDPASKARVVERLLERLHPQGYLFLGHAEGLHSLSSRVQSVGPTVYVHREGHAPRG